MWDDKDGLVTQSDQTPDKSENNSRSEASQTATNTGEAIVRWRVRFA